LIRSSQVKVTKMQTDEGEASKDVQGDEQVEVDQDSRKQQPQHLINLGAEFQAQNQRQQFVAPFPMAAQTLPPGSMATITTPLTNHEIYELIQKNQRQAGGQAQQQTAHRASSPIGGSLKQQKRQSSYLHQQQQSRLERQDSVIVGTPGFRERYGKFLGFMF